MNIKPMNKHVLCVPVEEKKGALILREEKFKTIFDIIEVGEGSSLEPGNRVFISKYTEIPLEVEDQTYWLIKEENILAVLN